MTDKKKNKQLMLAVQLKDQLAAYGIDATLKDARQLATLERILDGVDFLKKELEEASSQCRRAEVNPSNLARVTDISESTIYHSDDIRTIIAQEAEAAAQMSDRDELEGLRRKVEQLSFEVEGLRRLRDEVGRMQADLLLSNAKVKDLLKQREVSRQNMDSLYDKLESFLKEHPEVIGDAVRTFPVMAGRIAS